MRTAAIGATALAAVLLSGCFESDKPLITPANADYPFAERTHWKVFGGPKLDMPMDTGDLLLKDGYYQDPAQKDGTRFLFKAVDPEFYAAQSCEAANGSCIFVLMRIEGREVYSYDSDCSEETMLAFAPTGAIDRVEGNQRTRTCYLANLAGLMTIFRSLEGGTPRGKSTVE